MSAAAGASRRRAMSPAAASELRSEVHDDDSTCAGEGNVSPSSSVGGSHRAPSLPDVTVVRGHIITPSNASSRITRQELYAHEWEGEARTPAEEREVQFMIEERMLHEMKKSAVKREKRQAPLVFTELLMFARDGVKSIIEDDFTPCFQSKPPPRWNHSPLLFIMWVLGVLIRYLILFPIKVLFLVGGTLSLGILFAIVLLMKNGSTKTFMIRKILQWWAGVFILSWFGVVRYHGVFPARRANQIFVANHSSLTDYILLLHFSPFASVGQAHPGFLGALIKVISPLGNIMFNRFEARNRHLVTERLKAHIADVNNPPLLIFPEGVCVNNQYTVMWRKGAFEIDATVCPVAIKYNRNMCDPYWNSKRESFPAHLLRLMRSWFIAADVYFLEPQRIRSGESPIDFASRVQKLVANKARLKVCPWDGYLKYFEPSPRFKERKQKLFADILLKNYESSALGMPRTYTEDSLANSDTEEAGGADKPSEPARSAE